MKFLGIIITIIILSACISKPAPLPDVALSEYTSAVPLKIVSPRYPKSAALSNVEGMVTFTFDVMENGKPVNLKVRKSEPEGVFDRNAKTAIKQWKFETDKKDGDAIVAYRRVYTMEFKLSN